MLLTDRVVLITGGASGIGRAMARRFLAAGARVAIADKDRKALTKTRNELKCLGVEMDVTDPRSIERARGQIHKSLGRVEVLVNNAGIVFGGGFGDVPLNRHRLTVEINALGPVNVTHAFYSDLLESRESRIVFIASASGYIGLPKGAVYAATKWSIIGLAESIRAEVREDGRGPGVTLVCPSYIDTGLFAGARAPMLAPLLKTEEVAARVVAAVERDRDVLNMPVMVNIIPWARSLLPRFLYDAFLRITGVTRSMDHWKGR